jgi:hypothetical protein
MKPVKAILKSRFDRNNIDNKKVVLKTGTEVLILAKLEKFGATGTGYLIYEPKTNTFLELSSGHLKVENKENVKLVLPRFSLREISRDRVPTNNTVVSFVQELVYPEPGTTLTLGKKDNKEIVVIGVISSNEYPSGAAYILYDATKDSEHNVNIVDSLDVDITKQGNMITI